MRQFNRAACFTAALEEFGVLDQSPDNGRMSKPENGLYQSPDNIMYLKALMIFCIIALMIFCIKALLILYMYQITDNGLCVLCMMDCSAFIKK